MKDLVLRDCQTPMFNLMMARERGNLFASPGTGKTSATLMSLATLAATNGDVFPVLVVAPKRVANMVWTDEVNTWKQLRGIKVSKILGTPKQREDAMKARADVYTINYENLMWLTEKLGDRWPFRTVIADESTKLKNHRNYFKKTKDGLKIIKAGSSKNARALVFNADRTKYWYNLTGTPAANGLVDLWGQQFPVDFGKALGASFSAFRERWFRPKWGSRPEYQDFEPMPHAFKEITERLKPTSVVIDAYDYFDVTKPIELDVHIELPSSVREQYRIMHKEAVLELSKGTTTAVNAGSVMMKCRQIASGCIRDDDGSWQTLHNEKLSAVDEILDSIQGENLVVAYWFQHDLQALREKYPKAVVLESNHKQKDIIDRWNAGKIKMLLVHAQSAGHGLSLQHGGRHLCIYTQDWNAEYYAQVIERLGPIRQAQSGYKRMVYVHRLIAKNTCEEVVAARSKEKISMDEAIRRAVAMDV